MTDSEERFEVVIRADGGLEKEHAGLVARELTDGAFRTQAVHIRPIDGADGDGE